MGLRDGPPSVGRCEGRTPPLVTKEESNRSTPNERGGGYPPADQASTVNDMGATQKDAAALTKLKARARGAVPLVALTTRKHFSTMSLAADQIHSKLTGST